VSREALHDEEPDQIEGNYIVVGRPVPLWQPENTEGKYLGVKLGVKYFTWLPHL